MRIALTGASGFVGRYVLRELLLRDFEVTAISRSPDFIATQSGRPKWVLMDIANPPGNPFEKMGTPDILIHLAWDGLQNYQSPHHVETELPVQTAFLTSCIQGGLRRVVVTGTCYEYGLASGELTEDTDTQPCTHYGIAKDMLRRRLFELSPVHDLELAWLRLFYLYGEGQSQRSLYSSLQTAIRRGETSFDMSGGEQIRDFLPVGEAASLILEVALHDEACGVFNICSGNPTSLRQLVQSWIDEAGAKITMNLGRLPYSTTEPMAFWGSRRALDNLVGLHGHT